MTTGDLYSSRLGNTRQTYENGPPIRHPRRSIFARSTHMKGGLLSERSDSFRAEQGTPLKFVIVQKLLGWPTSKQLSI